MRLDPTPVAPNPAPSPAGKPDAPLYTPPPAPGRDNLPAFLPFSRHAFDLAKARRLPVFLLIGELTDAFCDPSLAMQLRERTVPVLLTPGARPDVELLCQRAAALTSGEGALPLCALLLSDGRPFLAAPLPPPGFPMDPSRLFVWLEHAERRYVQNFAALGAQAQQAMKALVPPPLSKPYSPADAAHDLARALASIEDRVCGGFGGVKAPLVCALRFLQTRACAGDTQAHAQLTRALDAMVASSLCDPIDGAFFRATLTDDWRVFIPEKPLGVNAMLALILLTAGRRTEAVRTLDFITSRLARENGSLLAHTFAPRDAYALTPQQVAAAVGNEDGLRACRLLRLLHQHTPAEPEVSPSRFSPVPRERRGRRLSMDLPPLTPRAPVSLTPEDAAFLRRVVPALQRERPAATLERPAAHVLTQDCALAAAVLAHCGARLGESKYTQAAQRAVSFLTGLPPAYGAHVGLPASIAPVSPLHAQATCGASSALALALLVIGQGKGMQAYAAAGLAQLDAALRAFVRDDGMVVHTPPEDGAFFPRLPAVYDSELPSPAAMLVHALRLADPLAPHAQYAAMIPAIWHAAAPAARAQPIALCSLITACRA